MTMAIYISTPQVKVSFGCIDPEKDDSVCTFIERNGEVLVLTEQQAVKVAHDILNNYYSMD